jgi:RNA polymerase sigma factor (sigma-70 family)
MLRLVKSPKTEAAAGTPGAVASGAAPVDELAALATAAVAGDEDAVRTLVNAIGPAVLRVVRRVVGPAHPEIEDVVQESIFGFLEGLPRFRGDCTTLHFACRVSVLTALKARRGSRARFEDAEPLADETVASPEASPLRQAVAARRRETMRALLGELPERQAEALTLTVLLGYSIEEVAAMVRAPANTVRSRLRAAKQALRDRVASDPDLEEALADAEEAP